MRWELLTSALLLAATVEASSPGGAISAAARDIIRVPTYERSYQRYLGLWYVPTWEKDEFLLTLTTQINFLSRKGTLRAPVVVNRDIIRVDIRWFGWDAAVWEKLVAGPHFHEDNISQDGRNIKLRSPGGWGDPTLYAVLINLCQTKVPVVAGPWFFIQTAGQTERVAPYYDWLGLKDRKDYFRLIGKDEKRSIERQRQFAAIVRRSGISRSPRQIFRDSADDFGSWRTLDVVLASTKKRNALDRLDVDYQHDAEEHYGFLPNGLFAFFLCDANGKKQDKAPDEVGPDSRSTSNRTVIEPPISCLRCHEEGLRPINNFAKRQFTQLRLSVDLKDYKKAERLELLYLRDYEHWMNRDNNDYAYALRQIGGIHWTPQRVARAYGRYWQMFNDVDLNPVSAGAELGTTAEHLLWSMRRWVKPIAAGGLGQRLPNSWGAFLQVPPEGIIRDHFEEHYALGQLIIRGTVPIIKIR